MSIASALFVRVIPGDKGRGYVLLAGWDKGVVHRTCVHMTTLSAVTRTSLDFAIARMKTNFNASEIIDVTADGIKKRLAKEFGETNQPAEQQAA